MKTNEKSKTLSLRLSNSDYLQICNNAQEANMCVSEYIRQSSLQSTITVNPHSSMIASNLCEITNLINIIRYEGLNNPKLNETFIELKKEMLTTWQYLK